MGPIEQLRSGESERQSWLQSRGQVSIKSRERKGGLFYERKGEKHTHEHLQMPGKRAVKQPLPEVLPVCSRLFYISVTYYSENIACQAGEPWEVRAKTTVEGDF